jgi:hypothetical protein
MFPRQTNHVTAATDAHATVEELLEAVFSVGFSDLNEMCWRVWLFTDFALRSVFMANYRLCEGGIGEICRPAVGVLSVVRNNQTSGKFECKPKSRTPQYRDSGNTGHRR